MMKCVCGRELGESMKDVEVIRRPCRCGLPERKIIPGAPHVWAPASHPNHPERERLGIPELEYNRT
jgi:hypothetical protein